MRDGDILGDVGHLPIGGGECELGERLKKTRLSIGLAYHGPLEKKNSPATNLAEAFRAPVWKFHSLRP